MNRKIVFAPGEYYHLYNRGVEKRTIFDNEVDRKRFLSLLYICNNTAPIVIRDLKDAGYSMEDIFDIERVPLVSIGAYCLMDNHFHLLIKEIDDGGITLFMKRFTTAYTMYFNEKNRRVGFRFCG